MQKEKEISRTETYMRIEFEMMIQRNGVIQKETDSIFYPLKKQPTELEISNIILERVKLYNSSTNSAIYMYDHEISRTKVKVHFHMSYDDFRKYAKSEMYELTEKGE